MLRSLWLLCLTGLLLATASSKSLAQVHPGDVRFFIDSSFVNFTSNRVRSDDGLGASNTTGVGLFGNGGLGIAYAVTKHIVPGMYFSIWREKEKLKLKPENGDNSDRDGAEGKAWELRPFLEIPFNPSSRFVFHGDVGLSILRPRPGPWTDEAIGVGPLLGLGAHGFVSEHVSIDTSVLFRAAFVFDDDAKDALEAGGVNDPKFRQLSVLVMVGASYWL
jgi:hypothetical protein